MNTKQQAANEIKRLFAMFPGLAALGEDLESIGSLEQTEGELKSRVEKLQGQIKAEDNRCAEAKTKAEELEKTHRSRMIEMEATAQKWREAAEAAATKIKTDAQGQADQMIADAGRRVAEAEERVAEAEKKLRKIRLDISEVEKNYASVYAQYDALKKRIA